MSEKRVSSSIEQVTNRLGSSEFQEVVLNNRMIVTNRYNINEDSLPSKYNVVSIFNLKSGTVESRSLLGFENDDRMAFLEANNYDNWKNYRT